MSKPADLYATRRLTEGYPGLDKLAHDAYLRSLHGRADHRPAIRRRLTYLNRLIDLDRCRNLLVIGCGPEPVTLQFLLELGYEAYGVEPVDSFVRTACEFLSSPNRVRKGCAEQIPFPDRSQHVVFMESVLEHVESPVKSLEEVFRVLAPGGVANIVTTNRRQLRLSGANGEFNKRFYNWLPALLKECYVFDHLHYRPDWANYTQRPAVHWFTYEELCALGRTASFAQFYSIVDLVRPEDPTISGSFLRRFMLRRVQRSPWLRALALTQVGGTIFMWKRGE